MFRGIRTLEASLSAFLTRWLVHPGLMRQKMR